MLYVPAALLRNGRFEVMFYDAAGRLLRHSVMSGEPIDLNSLPPGLYFLKIRQKERLYHQKLIINGRQG